MLGACAAQTADIWIAVSAMAGMVAVMFAWLKLDIYRLGKRVDRHLERLEDH